MDLTVTVRCDYCGIRDAEIQLRNDEQTIIDAYTRNQITSAERQHIEDLRENFFRKYGHQP